MYEVIPVLRAEIGVDCWTFKVYCCCLLTAWQRKKLALKLRQIEKTLGEGEGARTSSITDVSRIEAFQRADGQLYECRF
jgi:hypothetical protein